MVNSLVTQPPQLAVVKQHCQLTGDAFFVYELNSNKLLEFSENFSHHTGFLPTEQFEQQCQQLFHHRQPNITPLSQAHQQRFDYQINKSTASHWLRCISYQHLDPEYNLNLILCTFSNVDLDYCHHEKCAQWQQSGHNQLGYLQQLLMDLYRRADMEYAFLVKPTSADQIEAQTIVAIHDNKIIDNITYDLADTPCKNTMSGSFCTYSSEVQLHFPNDCLLSETASESYLGMPFFDDDGKVCMILVLLNNTSMVNKEHLITLVQNAQPQLIRHFKLLEADLLLSEINKSSIQCTLEQSCTDCGSIDGLLDNGLISPLMRSLSNHKWAEICDVIFKSTKEAIIITDANNKIISVNKALTQITGYEEHEIIGRNPNILSSGRNSDNFYHQMFAALKDHGHWEGEIRNRKKSGELYFEWLNIRVIHDETGNTSHYIAIFSDISEHKNNQNQLYFQANFDPLTQLANRSFLFFHIAKSLAATDDSDSQVALIHIDLNGLTNINEHFGYETGDEILRQTAQRLRELTIANSLIARISGDGFAILLKDSPTDHALSQLASHISGIINKPLDIDGLQITIRAAIGVATSQDSNLPAEKLLLMTEQALLKAKDQTQSHVFLFSAEFQEQLRIELQLEHDLALALKDDQLELYYQPQIDALTGNVLGVEALVRWNHPTMGLLQPGQFIPLAEKTGQIIELGNVVLTKACQTLRQWHLNGIDDITMAVNVSPRQFVLEHTTHDLETIINQSGVDPTHLVLEITEDVFLSDNILLQATLNRLKKTGIQLSLDDFGTGFSSLSYLQQYPLDVLKIDRAFVKKMSQKSETNMIVKAIISMAQAMNLKVVAEGVETLEQVSVLQQYQCNIFQGFFYSKPLPEVALKNFIKRVSCASAKNDSISIPQIVI